VCKGKGKPGLRVGVLSDIHFHRDDHAAEIEALVKHISSVEAPDLIVLAGDISHRVSEIRAFLGEVKADCPKCWVPGNHDIWVIDAEFEGDTAEYRYEVVFPQLSAELGWHYLPKEPVVYEDRGIGIVGSIGWFTGPGYSEWFDAPASESDEELARHLAEGLDQAIVELPPAFAVVVVTHHVSHILCPCYEESERKDVNEHVQRVLQRHRERLLLAIHGHKHVRYGPVMIDGVCFLAHPFGYPAQHSSVGDGYRVLDISRCSE
jgi:3',5'-cyclic AMP phosphodiesterase CpdA